MSPLKDMMDQGSFEALSAIWFILQRNNERTIEDFWELGRLFRPYSLDLATGAKVKKSVGGVHNPNFPTTRLHLSPICQHFYQQYNIDEYY